MARLVTLKSTVKPANLVILAAACNSAAEMGISITVTSGNDSQHMAGSRHFSNEALDFRSKDMDKVTYTLFIDKMRARLGSRYQVIHESIGRTNQHIHVELDA